MGLEEFLTWGKLTLQRPDGPVVNIQISSGRMDRILKMQEGIKQQEDSVTVMSSRDITDNEAHALLVQGLDISFSLIPVPTIEEALSDILTEKQLQRIHNATSSGRYIRFQRAPKRPSN